MILDPLLSDQGAFIDCNGLLYPSLLGGTSVVGSPINLDTAVALELLGVGFDRGLSMESKQPSKNPLAVEPKI